MNMIVTENDIMQAFAALGITRGDTVLVHSSLKSFGALENGPETVIRGIEKLLGKEGTLVMPTLCSVDFTNSYKTWYMDKPSDVGYLTEYFRKLPYVYRSNHATHSVAARGKLAYEFTYEHDAYGPRHCPFGEYAFADSSPWIKMYNNDVHIVFIGVDMTYNTMKHVVESRFIELLLAKISDESKRQQMKSRLWKFETFEEEGIWPFYEGTQMEKELDAVGMVSYAHCGKAKLRRVSAKLSSDFALKQLQEFPEKWCDGETLAWIRECS